MNLQSTLRSIALTLTLIAVALLTRQYSGIRHDSIIYFGQALAVVHPAVFAKDLFFVYGSQASFTVFPQVVAFALGSLNAHQVASIGLLSSLVALVAVSVWAGVGLVGRRWAWILAFGVLLLPAGYGGRTIFSYGEAFFTARSIAEPLVMVGVGLIWRGRWAWAVIPLLVAAMFHPLQALPGFIFWWVSRLQADRRWWWLLIGVIPVLFVANAIPSLSDKVFARYDDEWWAWIAEWSKHLSMRSWTYVNWCVVATDGFLLWLAWKKCGPAIRGVAMATLVTLVIGLMSSLILADGLRLVLPTGLQLWRTHWIAHWVVVLLVPVLLQLLVREHGWRDVRIALFIVIVAFGMAVGDFVVAHAALFSIPLFLIWPRIEERVSNRLKSGLIAALVFAIVVFYGRFVANVFGIDDRFTRELEGTTELLLMHPVAAIAIGFVAWWVWRKGYLAVNVVMTLMAIGGFAYGIYGWDARTALNKALEGGQSTHSQIAPSILGKLPPDAQIYWEKSAIFPWLGMRRASYWSSTQLAGALFNRGTAKEGFRRERMLLGLEFSNSLCELQNNLTGDELQCVPRLQTMSDACIESAGGMTHMVFRNQLAQAVSASWQAPKERSSDPERFFYLYACSDLVKLQAAESAKGAISSSTANPAIKPK